MTDYYRGRRVLITGGLGFIGSNLAAELVERGAEVTLIDAILPEYGATLENIAPFHELVAAHVVDVRDEHALPFFVRNQAVIFSLAAQVSHIDSMHQPLVDLDINYRSQLALLECCRRENPTARLVTASTRQVYGRPQFLPVTEEHPLAPTDINGINKLAADQAFQLYAQVYGMCTVSLRLTNTYGPRMDLNNPRKGFVGVFLRQALDGQPLRVFGDGSQRRDFNYVSDVAHALALAGEVDGLGGQVFNLGHDEHFSLLQFLDTLSTQCPLTYRCVPFPAERQAIDIGDYYGDYSKFFSLTGWRPRVGLADGLRLTVDYFRQATEPAV
jgi:nucleoside-diphosphate-sugar epimerase